MTVTYTAEVATCRGFGCFLKLLFRWRGSIYKLVWLDLSCFLLVYYILNLMYRFLLTLDQKRTFEDIVKYCHANGSLIPLSFVLGFYVTIVMTRWWNQYTSIPWPDSIAVFVSTNVHGQDERGRVMRRTTMRYVCLCLTMVLCNISPRVKKRFPTLDHYVEAGLMNDNEYQIIHDLNIKFPRHSKHWLPIVWAASIITRARKEGRIRDDFAVKTIIDELNKFRGQCGLLISYDTISIPLVYTQVVTVAVYSYFLAALMGAQWVENKELSPGVLNKIDLYFPIFTTLQFFFYMGWLKVAESLINPFGEDDDDFEVNWMIDRNLQVSYLIVDEMHHEHPELIKDQYWDDVFPLELPYTVGSMNNREEPPKPSTDGIEITDKAAEVIPVAPSSVKVDEMVGNRTVMDFKFPDINDDDEGDDNTSGIHFSASTRRDPRRKSASASNTSMHTLAGTMSRVNTVASALKRFLSRDDGSRPGSSTPSESANNVFRFPGSVSAASLVNRPERTQSMRITDQVIEEVDEQNTITSMANNDPRPTAQSLFQQGPPKASEPVDVPGNNSYNRTQSEVHPQDQSFLFPSGGVDSLLSTSAPGGRFEPAYNPDIHNYKGDDQNMGSQETQRAFEELDNVHPTDEADDFERLRQAREKERVEKAKFKLVRSISIQGDNVFDPDVLLDKLTQVADEKNTSGGAAGGEPSTIAQTTSTQTETNL